MKGKVVCIGSLNVDNSLYVEGFCKDDQEQPIAKLMIGSGGQAANVADGLARLGKQACFYGNIGNDAHTKMLLKDLDAAGVDYSLCRRTDNPNNVVYAIIDKYGRRQLYAYNYVDLALDEVPEGLFNDASFVVFTSLIMEGVVDFYVALAKQARRRGTAVVMDPGNILAKLGLERLNPLLALCDYILPSRSEVELLVGSIGDVEKLAALVPHVIVTRSEEGASYYAKGSHEHFPVKPLGDRRCVDTTGAGDCFTAAFVAALLDGRTVLEAIGFSLLASRLSITRRGARCMPSPEEIEVFEHE